LTIGDFGFAIDDLRFWIGDFGFASRAADNAITDPQS
jgi:hypothetical protein